MFQDYRERENGRNYNVMKWDAQTAVATFEELKNPLWIKVLKTIRWYISKDRKLINIFENQKKDW